MIETTEELVSEYGHCCECETNHISCILTTDESVRNKRWADVEKLIPLLKDGLSSWDEAYRIITKLLKLFKEVQ